MDELKKLVDGDPKTKMYFELLADNVALCKRSIADVEQLLKLVVGVEPPTEEESVEEIKMNLALRGYHGDTTIPADETKLNELAHQVYREGVAATA
jgi:hypothetical protein